MNSLKSKAFAAVLLAGFVAQPAVVLAAPQLTIQSEKAGHPRLAKGIEDAEALYRTLQSAPDDFGGNKAKAMGDLHTAIHSLKRALYYRLHLDDAAIDAAQ